MIEAVVFDLDGVLLQSEEVWNEMKEAVTRERGGRWHGGAPRDMMGMSSPEWSAYMRDRLNVPLSAGEIDREVVARVQERYSAALPLIDGAHEAVERVRERWPIAIASSSNRPVIDLVLELAGWNDGFAATVSSEEVERGKPAPDVYLEAARRLNTEPQRCAAIEDSANGIRAARAAGMRTIAVPNPTYPPEPDALEQADVVLHALTELTHDVVEPG